MSKSPVALIILDGFGLREETKGNAVTQAKKPNFDRFWANYPQVIQLPHHSQLMYCEDNLPKIDQSSAF